MFQGLLSINHLYIQLYIFHLKTRQPLIHTVNWDYIQPVKIRFGKGRIAEVKDIAKQLGIKNGILVADPFFFTNGLAEKIINESDGMIVTSFGDLSPP